MMLPTIFIVAFTEPKKFIDIEAYLSVLLYGAAAVSCSCVYGEY